MPNTPNYNLYYPSSTDRPAAFPAAQKTSQETLDTLLKQISDSVPAGDTSTLNAAKTYADQKVAGANYATPQQVASGDAATLASAKADSTTKAGNAESNAKDYTDIQIGNLDYATPTQVTDGDTSTLASANSYTDDQLGSFATVDRSAGTAIRLRADGLLRVVFYESGFRSLYKNVVTGSLPNENGLQISRTNDLVEIRLIRWKPGQAGEIPLIASLPGGFRPRNTTTLFVSDNGTPTDLSVAFSNGAISVLVHSASAEISGVVHYRVNPTLPTSLPGDPL